MYNRIKDLRIDKDLLQKDLAKILNITQAQYSRIEKNEYQLSYDGLIKLAFFYDTSIDYLLRDNKSKFALSSCEYQHKKIRL